MCPYSKDRILKHQIISTTAGIVISYDTVKKWGRILLSNRGQNLDEIERNCNPCKIEELNRSGLLIRFPLKRVAIEDAGFFNSETIIGCKIICEAYYKNDCKNGRWIITNIKLAEDKKMTVPQDHFSQKLPGSRIRVERRLERVNQIREHNLARPWLIPFKS